MFPYGMRIPQASCGCAMTIPITVYKYVDFLNLSPGWLEWGGTHKYAADFGNKLGGIRGETNSSRRQGGSWMTFMAVLLVFYVRRIAGGHYRVVWDRSSAVGVFCSRIGGPFQNCHQSIKYGYANWAQCDGGQEGMMDKTNLQLACRDPLLRLLRFDWSPGSFWKRQFFVWWIIRFVVMTVLKGAVHHRSVWIITIISINKINNRYSRI